MPSVDHYGKKMHTGRKALYEIHGFDEWEENINAFNKLYLKKYSKYEFPPAKYLERHHVQLLFNEELSQAASC